MNITLHSLYNFINLYKFLLCYFNLALDYENKNNIFALDYEKILSDFELEYETELY